MKILKKSLSLVMIVMLLVSVVPFSANATDKTADEAIDWVKSKVGQSVDVDGANGAQCVDLILAYYDFLGVKRSYGNGSDFAHNPLPDGWQRYQGGVPQKGDILVYTGGAYGHVAIYESDKSLYQQNFNNHSYVEQSSFKYNTTNISCVYWGCIHPNFENSAPSKIIPTAKLKVEREYYNPGDRISFTLGGENTTGVYMLRIYKGSEPYATVKVNGGSYSMILNDIASYSAYMTSYSGTGDLANSNWIHWTVRPPSYIYPKDTNNTSDTNTASKQNVTILQKQSPEITVKNTVKSFKVKTLKKKSQSFNIGASVNSRGKLTYKKVSGNKKITINKKGKITVKKGLKRGIYKAKIKISAGEKGQYIAGSKTVVVKITVTNKAKPTTIGLQATSLKKMSNANIINKVSSLFITDQKSSGILASVSLAQFILESGYGKLELPQNANNCFGMKKLLSGNTWGGSTWDGSSVYTQKTQEYKNGKYITITADFRKYTSVEKSIADHSAYLLGAKAGNKLRYEGLKGCKDYKKAIQIIKNGGYATSPTYVEKICEIIEKWNLTQYDIVAS